MQNIKVDVIYYKTPTDFEMEFNLCGCCRMRMLTDKASDRRSLIHSLSRAVSRSRIIICAGPLFDDEGLINNVALAIGKPTEPVDIAEYNIRSGEPISVIKGAVPLVTEEGIFGGCIIESGPQSIILISESRSIRKSLMNSLIHPYIEELSIASVSSAYAPDTEAETEKVSEQEIKSESEIPGEPENSDAESESGKAENVTTPDLPVEPDATDKICDEIEEPVSAEQIPKESCDENRGIEMLFGNEQSNLNNDYYSTDSFDYDEPDEFIIEDNGKENLPPRFFRMTTLIITAVLLVALLLLMYLLVFEPLKSGIGIAEYIGSLFDGEAASKIIKF